MQDDICKYIIDWPSGATYKDRLVFDTNVVDRATLFLVAAKEYGNEDLGILVPELG